MRNLGQLLEDIDRIFKTDRPYVMLERLERIAFLNSIMNPIVFFFMSKYAIYTQFKYYNLYIKKTTLTTLKRLIRFFLIDMKGCNFFFIFRPFRDHTIRLVTCGKVIMKSQDASSMSKRTGSTGISRGQSSSAGAKATQKSSALPADKATSSGKSDSSKPVAAITDKPNGNPPSAEPDKDVKADSKVDVKDDTKTDANADTKTDAKNNI